MLTQGEAPSTEGRAGITGNDGLFHIQFTSWGSQLGAEIEQNGARLLTLVSPPWSGSLRFQTVPQTGHIVDGGQEKYAFSKPAILIYHRSMANIPASTRPSLFGSD